MTKQRTETQLYRLTQLFVNCPGDSYVRKSDIVKLLGVADPSVPVYIHSLKKKFKANVENVCEGRTVVGYRLTNIDEIIVPQFKRTVVPQQTTTVAVAPKKTTVVRDHVPILDRDVDTNHDVHDVLDSIGYVSRNEHDF
jgi:hypothetical protein